MINVVFSTSWAMLGFLIFVGVLQPSVIGHSAACVVIALLLAEKALRNKEED